MKRRDFLKTVGFATTAGLLPGCVDVPDKKKTAAKKPAAAKKDTRPNILWLISEDTSPDLACYGNTLVKTPWLDRLAREGTMYTNAFVTGPVCSASRSALMTGMYQTTIGAQNHRSHRGDGYRLPPPVTVITEYFREAGYFVCNCDGLNYKKPGKTDWNFMSPPGAFEGTDWSERQPGQPFFAQINFGLTHRAFKRDERNPIDPQTVELPPYYPDHPVARRDWADYLESIQLLDTQIGVILIWLEREGLADNTIVMYFGDHGRPHVRGKQWLYEGGVRIPLIVRWPGHVRRGDVVHDLVSSIDFAPTCMIPAGIKPPKHLQGHAFFGSKDKARKYIFAARDRCDETVDRIRCVRSARYKYIRNYYPDRPYTQFNAYKKLQYPVLTLLQVLDKQGQLTPEQARFMASSRPPEELYDLRQDPYELHNLADSKDHRKVLREHSSKLDEWIKATHDQGEIPESPEVIQYWQQQSAASYKQQMEARGLSPDVSDEDYLKWWEQKLLS